MKKLNLYYQSNRVPKDGTIYYPEDNRTPEQRVDYLIELGASPEAEKEVISVVSACPYIVEGSLKVFPDRELKCYIDEEEVDAEKIFNKMAVAMQRLFFI